MEISSLTYTAIAALILLFASSESQSIRPKEGMCKRCSCEMLNKGPNQTLKLDCSRHDANDIEDLLGFGDGKFGGVWKLPREASVGVAVVRIILDANSIHHLRALKPLEPEMNTTTDDKLLTTGMSELTVSPNTPSIVEVSSTTPSLASSNLPSSVGKPPLIELSLRSNHMERIDTGAFISLTKTLWSLDLSSNDLTYEALPASVFQGEFSAERYEPLVVFEKLSLARNKLHALDSKLFEHISQTLQELNLQGNYLGKSLDAVTEHALSTLEKLRILNLADTGITSYPEGLAHALKSLERLRLDGNELKTVPMTLSMASSSLLYLNLNRNPIKKLNATSFMSDTRRSPWSKLEVLDINAVPELETVSKGAFENLPELRQLRCAYNRNLAHFDREAFRAIEKGSEWDRWRDFKLKEVELQGNGLQWLSPDVMNWNDLDSVDLQSNPWACDCSLKPLANAIRTVITSKTPNLSVGLKCYIPLSLRGVNFLTSRWYNPETNGTASSEDEPGNGTGSSLDRLWSNCNSNARLLSFRRGATASALLAVAVTAMVAILVVLLMIVVVRRSIRAERLNMPGQVRYVRAPPTKDEDDEFVIMDMRWASVGKDNAVSTVANETPPVALGGHSLGTEYRWPPR